MAERSHRDTRGGRLASLSRALSRALSKRRAAPAPADAGRWGEAEAARELKRAGLRVLGRRVRVGRRDELDLVARDGDTLVFVEVKTRAREDYGRPIEAVNREKRRNLSRAAVRYVGRLRKQPAFIRFDVVEVVGAPGGPPPEIRHIPNAFPLSTGYRWP